MGLTLTDVTLTYPDGDTRLTALDAVSLHVPAGTVTAVVGPSGSGKSSLLAVAATLITPDSGEVTIDATPISGLSRAARTALRRTRIGMVFQQPNLIPALTAAEQVELMARIDGRRESGSDLLAAVGLTDRARHRPHQLSGGQRQRVNIARALANRPGVLLVDEPTSALDHERGGAVIDLITALTRRLRIATVLVTHDHTHLDAVDEVVRIVDGRASRPVSV